MKLSKLSYVLILIGLVLSSASHAQNHQKNQPAQNDSGTPSHPKKNTTTKQEQRGTKDAPFFIEIVSPNNANKEPDADQRAHQEETAERRHRETIAATNRGVWASFGQFFGLICTIGVMILTANRQLRAYVFVHEISIVPSRSDKRKPGDFDVAIILKNGGSTPAYHVRIFAGASQQSSDQEKFTDPFTNLTPARLDIGPGATMNVDIDRVFNETHRSALQGTDTVIYISGTIRYRTAFTWHIGRDRITSFRHVWRPGKDDRLQKTPDGNWSN